jgi:tRNA nucleotidyltransferase (CCA-adding enzyme)
MALEKIKSVCEEVLSRVIPEREETEKALMIFKEVSSYLEPILNELKYPYKITLEGSVSRDTHLRNDTDLDIFILIRYEGMTREWLEDLINKISVVLDRFKPKKLYASHPYLRFKVEGIEVDVVPAFMALDVSEVRTAVDRTVFHTNFVKSRLSKDQVNEVRLLKRFFKGVEVYGAEIRTEGFSGYLTELLVIYYGDFINTIKGLATWTPPQVIDFLKLYKDLKEYVRLYGRKPLIFPDPVDSRRNVAAALSMKSFSIAVLAARMFLENPSLKFFYPQANVSELYWDNITGYISRRKTAIVGYLIHYLEGTSPDIIWGELKRCLRRGINVLRSYGFEVLDANVWCDEVNTAVILYEISQEELTPFVLHNGPKVFRDVDVRKFLDKYLRSSDVVGPWINDYGELVILKPRKYRTPSEVLLNESKTVLHAKHIVYHKVVKLEDLTNIYSGNDEFKVWLYKFIRKKPLWL